MEKKVYFGFKITKWDPYVSTLARAIIDSQKDYKYIRDGIVKEFGKAAFDAIHLEALEKLLNNNI